MSEHSEYNRKAIIEFRANRDKGQPSSEPMILVTIKGAKSGIRRTMPLMYVPDGDRLMIIASNMGAPKHPDWYYNLLAHPDVTVEVGVETFEAVARVAQGEERVRLWKDITERYPFFIEHQGKTSRQIPIVLLSRKVSL